MPYVSYDQDGQEKNYQLPDDRMVIFGREDHTDFQILKDSQISREHFSLERSAEGYFSLMDLGSSNGTYLNGRKLESNAIRRVKHGDVIRVGRQQFTFWDRVAPPKPLEKPGRQSSGELMKDVIHDLQQGKGYHTIMSEIIAKGKSSPSKPKPELSKSDS